VGVAAKGRRVVEPSADIVILGAAHLHVVVLGAAHLHVVIVGVAHLHVVILGAAHLHVVILGEAGNLLLPFPKFPAHRDPGRIETE
jgi:hypothetical protein